MKRLDYIKMHGTTVKKILMTFHCGPTCLCSGQLMVDNCGQTTRCCIAWWLCTLCQSWFSADKYQAS